MQQDEAETIALRAVAYIAQEEDLMNRFLAMTGIDGGEIRERIGDPAFLGAVLDYLLGFEPDLIAFAEWAELKPETVMRARHTLPGVNPEW